MQTRTDNSFFIVLAAGWSLLLDCDFESSLPVTLISPAVFSTKTRILSLIAAISSDRLLCGVLKLFPDSTARVFVEADAATLFFNFGLVQVLVWPFAGFSTTPLPSDAACLVSICFLDDSCASFASTLLLSSTDDSLSAGG